MDKYSIARLIIFILAWVNNVLASKGMHTIPVLDEKTVAMYVALVISAYTFYKDNFIGKKGKVLKDAIVKESELVIEKVINSKQAADIVTKVVDNQPTTPVQPVANVTTQQPTQPTDTNQTK